MAEKVVSIAGELVTFTFVMAGKLNKTSKRILSILFHLVVLVGMVIAYDTVKAIIETVQMDDGIEQQTDGATADDTKEPSLLERAKSAFKSKEAAAEEKK